MRANEISLGWAMRQSDPAAAMQQVLANIASWWGRKSETFSRLCATERGEQFTHGQVVLTHLALVAVFILMCVASWLEGGAA